MMIKKLLVGNLGPEFVISPYCVAQSDTQLVCLFLAQRPPSGPGPPHSRGF